jgi:hypothetical protein
MGFNWGAELTIVFVKLPGRVTTLGRNSILCSLYNLQRSRVVEWRLLGDARRFHDQLADHVILQKSVIFPMREWEQQSP